ncbi:MAG: hypothetical protein AAFZ63_25190 [Bacteroidota bacterium]
MSNIYAFEMSAKEDFRNALDYLFEDQGIKLPVISKKSGIPLQKLRDIRIGRSSGGEDDLNALVNVFPFLKAHLTGDTGPVKVLGQDEIDSVRREYEEKIRLHEEAKEAMRKTIESLEAQNKSLGDMGERNEGILRREIKRLEEIIELQNKLIEAKKGNS